MYDGKDNNLIVEISIDNNNWNQCYANFSASNLQTFSGKIETIEVSYLMSGSLK